MPRIQTTKVYYELDQAVMAGYTTVSEQGSSRCFAPGTLVRMYDGKTKAVENIQVGDKVMDISGAGYNTVAEIHSGRDMMYRIRQARGEDYVVNSKHILALRQTRAKQHKIAIPGFKSTEKRKLELLPFDRTIVHNFPVDFYVGHSKNFQQRYTGFQNTLLQLPEIPVPVDPYYFGLWIGDGCAHRYYEITNVDKEILEYFYQYAKDLGSFATQVDKVTHRIKVSQKRLSIPINEKVGAIKDFFYGRGLIDNKYIPDDFIYTSYDNRLKLLAGVIDSDGYKTDRGTYYITLKSLSLIKSLRELCRITGFYVHGIVEKEAKMKRKDGSVYKCKVYSIEINHKDFEALNEYIKCSRKRIQGKKCERDYFTSSIQIEPEGIGEYYGFTLDKSPYFLLEDGTVCHNSGKTYNTVIWLCVYLMNHAGLRLSVVRKTLTALRGSVLLDFKDVLLKMRLWNWKDKAFNKSDWTFTFPNGSWIEFFSTDDEQKLRGRKRDICYVNEANELSALEWQQLKMRTTMFTIADYNPSFSDEHWLCSVNADPRTYHFITTYKDNPFLEQTIIEEIESLRDKNKSLWQIYGLGLQAVVEGLIFTNVEIVDEIPQYAKKHHWRGCDWGYSLDPTAIEDVYYHNGCLYVDEICYQTGMLASDIIRVLKENDGAIETICDSADPRLIQEVYRGGCNVKPVTKYPGSVNAGIIKMQEFKKIYITKRSYNIKKEFQNYVWAQDKEGKWLNQPAGGWDHCFVGETLITTNKGDKKIVDIIPGDYILTSGGYRQVLANHNNGYKKVFEFTLTFINFKVKIICTPEHKIKTTKGWKEIQNLQPGDTLFLKQPLTEKPSTYIKENAITREEAENCISLSGSTTMAPFPKVAKYITRISIALTTIYQTLNALLQRSIKKGTGKELRKECADQSKSLTLNALGKKQANGTGAKRGENGTRYTPVLLRHLFNPRRSPASVVAASSSQRRAMPNSALTTASQSGAGNRDLTMKQESVNTAEKNLQSISIPAQPTVRKAVLSDIAVASNSGIIREVYDLTVEDIHEYIANGIVVHNCIDGIRYVVSEKIMGGKPKPVNLERLARIAY